jgi:hypothetical protein
MALLRPVGSARNPLGSIEKMIESESAIRNERRKGRRIAIENENGTSRVKKKENLTVRGSETRNEEIETEVKTTNEEAEVLVTTIGTTSTIMNADFSLENMADLNVNGTRTLTVKRIATAISLQNITEMTRKKRGKTRKIVDCLVVMCQVTRKTGMTPLKRKRVGETEVMRMAGRKESRRTGLRVNVQKRHVHFSLLAKHYLIFLQRPRYSREEVPFDRMSIDKRQDSAREETPEEGEI